MSTGSVSSLRLFIYLVFVFPPVALSGDASTRSEAQEVELNLSLRAVENGRLAEYAVELRNSSGDSVRIVTAVAGERIHWKHLKPDVYMACLQGDDIPKTCKSIDMFPPREIRNYKFSEEITIPSACKMPDLHAVSIDQLRVSEKARQEMSRSLDALSRGDVQGEIAHLQHALDISPDYVDALNNLGYYYHSTGNQALSIHYLTRVTDLDPDGYLGWSNLAGTLLSAGRLEETLRAASRALNLWTESVTANSQLAWCYYHLKRYPEAEKYFRKVLALDPASCTFPMLYLAQIALLEDRREDAAAWIGIFLKVHPNYPSAPLWVETLGKIKSGEKIEQPFMTSVVLLR